MQEWQCSKRGLHFAAIYLVFKERPFGKLRIFAALRGTDGPPTIRGTCAFALNFGATPSLRLHVSGYEQRGKNF